MTDVAAFALRSQRLGTRLACGVWPKTFPPSLAVTSDDMRRARVLYFTLHGAEGDDRLRDELGMPVLDARDIPALQSTLVFMAGCWGAPYWASAFLEAGAAAVVADNNVAWAGKHLPLGSHAMGWLWLRLLRRGATASKALERASTIYRTVARSERDVEMLETLQLYGDAHARL